MAAYTIPILNRMVRMLPRASPDARLLIRFPQTIAGCMMSVVDWGMYLLGPILISVALGIMLGLTHTFFYVLLPMIRDQDELRRLGAEAVAVVVEKSITPKVAAHVALVFFFLVNVIHNYFLCVTTRNNGPNYDRVVQELADATDFSYPKSAEEIRAFRQDFEDMIILRGRARRAVARRGRGKGGMPIALAASGNGSEESPNGEGATPMDVSVSASSGIGGSNGGEPLPPQHSPDVNAPRQPSWTLMASTEWGYCVKSNQPKPPRSHYDNVTKALVLNLDHYCPWMFNCVGYFNYRYFCNFLVYVQLSMVYGFWLALRPFTNMNQRQYRAQVKLSVDGGYDKVQHLLPWVPTPDERTPVAFTFMLCLSVGIAITLLGGFHLYLLLTAQTTIEFHGNCARRRSAASRGGRWANPYSLGWRKNWQLVYGSSHPLLAMLPSRREPEFLPIPIAGELVRVRKQTNHGYSILDRSGKFDEEDGLSLLKTNRDQEQGARQEFSITSQTRGSNVSKRRIAGAFGV